MSDLAPVEAMTPEPPQIPSVEELLRDFADKVETHPDRADAIANTAMLIRVRVMLDAQTEARID